MLWSDVQWSLALVQEAVFTFRWLEWTMEFHYRFRTRERKALGKEAGPGAAVALLSPEEDGVGMSQSLAVILAFYLLYNKQ